MKRRCNAHLFEGVDYMNMPAMVESLYKKLNKQAPRSIYFETKNINYSEKFEVEGQEVTYYNVRIGNENVSFLVIGEQEIEDEYIPQRQYRKQVFSICPKGNETPRPRVGRGFRNR